MKLLIAIPAHEQIPVDFVECLLKLEARLKADGVEFEIKFNSGTLVYVARDKLACHAINNGFTHVLWLDSDMVFQDSILDDLMFSGKSFVTGICFARRPPYVPCVFKSMVTMERFEEFPGQPFEVAGCGFACVLIETEILKDVQLTFKSCFLPTAQLGEDLAFCDRARYLKHRIFADPAVRLGHIAHIPIYQEHHKRYMQSIEGGTQ